MINQNGVEEERMKGVVSSAMVAAITQKRCVLLLTLVCAEMVGTFIVVFSICAVVAVGEESKGRVGLMEYAATAAFAIMIVIFSIGHISGAHVNPAVTIAYAAARQFPWAQVPLYVSAQLTSSILATFIAKKVYSVNGELAVTKPSSGSAKAFWVELIATFFIMFLASSLSLDVRAIGQLAGVAVGASIAMGVIITASVSGASMNPARSFGPAVVANNYDHIWVYFLGPTIGAVAGSLLYRLLRLPHQPTPASSHPPPLDECGTNSERNQRTISVESLHERMEGNDLIT